MADGEQGRPDPEMPERGRRRSSTAKYRPRVLAAYEAAEPGEKDAILRQRPRIPATSWSGGGPAMPGPRPPWRCRVAARGPISHWAKTGTVPAKWHSKIIQAAADQGLSVAAVDLVSTPTIVKVQPSKVPVAVVGAVLSVGDEDDPIPCAAMCWTTAGVRSRARARWGHWRTDGREVGGDLQRYVKPVQDYLRVNLDDELVEFLLDNVANKRIFGITAECYLEICRAFVRASRAGALHTEVQQDIAKNAVAFRPHARTSA